MKQIYCPNCKTNFDVDDNDDRPFYYCSCGQAIKNKGFFPNKTRWTQGYQHTHTGRRSVEGI